LQPIHHFHCEKNHRAKGLLMEGCHAKRASTKGTKLYNVVGSHASLIAIHLPSWGFQQTNIEQTVCMRQKP
jgi:hypothetical protein